MKYLNFGILKDMFLSYFQSGQPSVKYYEAYALEPIGSYLVFIVGTIFLSACLCHIVELKFKNLSNFNVLDTNMIKSVCILYLTMLSLPSYYNDKVAIFETSRLLPHFIIACLIGIVLNDILYLYMNTKEDVLSMKNIFVQCFQVYKSILNIFVLTNTNIMNIYIFLVFTVILLRLCRLCINYLYNIKFGIYSKHALHAAFFLILGIEYYVVYDIFNVYRHILPQKETVVLKSVSLCVFIWTSMNFLEEMVVDIMY